MKMKRNTDYLCRTRIAICGLFSIIFYALFWTAISTLSAYVGLGILEVIAAGFLLLMLYLPYELKTSSARKWATFACTLGTLLVSICVLSLQDFHETITVFLLFVGIYLVCECEARLFKFDRSEIDRELPQDTLNRSFMFSGVHAWIRKMSLEKNEHGYAVAITGQWGSGKTFLRDYLVYRLSKCHEERREDSSKFCNGHALYKGRYSIGEVNIWGAKSFEEAWAKIEAKLLEMAGGSNLNKSKNIFNILKGILRIFINFDAELEDAVKKVVYDTETDDINDYAQYISSCMAQSEKQFGVLFIDDIERSTPTLIEALLPLIERLKKIPRLFVICNYSRREIENKLARKQYQKDEVLGYLVKIFDITFELPITIEPLNQKRYMQILTDQIREVYPLTSHFLRQSKLRFETPRQAERIVKKLSAVEALYLSYSYNEEWSELYSSKAIFIVECINQLRPQVVVEMLDCGIDKYLDSCLPSAGNAEKFENWRQSYHDTYQAITSHDFLRSLLEELKKMSAAGKTSQINNSLSGQYRYKLAFTNHEIDEFINAKRGQFAHRMKLEMLHYFPETIPIWQLVSIENAYKLCLKNINQKTSYSNAILTTIANEVVNSKFNRSDDRTPFQLRSTYFEELFAQLMLPHCPRITSNIVFSLLSIIKHTTFASMECIIRFLYMNSTPLKLNYDLKLSHGKNVLRPKWAEFLILYSYREVGVKYLVFLLANSHVKNTDYTMFVNILIVYSHHSHSDKKLIPSIIRGVEDFYNKRKVIAARIIAALLRYLTIKKKIPNIASPAYILTCIDYEIFLALFNVVNLNSLVYSDNNIESELHDLCDSFKNMLQLHQFVFFGPDKKSPNYLDASQIASLIVLLNKFLSKNNKEV